MTSPAPHASTALLVRVAKTLNCNPIRTAPAKCAIKAFTSTINQRCAHLAKSVVLSVQQQPALPAQRSSSKARLFASSARLEKAYRETLVSLRCVHKDAKLARRQPALLANKVLRSTREAVLVQSKKVTSTQTQAYALTVRLDVQDVQRINVLHAQRGSLWHRRSA